MAGRLRTRFVAVALGLLLAACVEVSPGAGPQTPEQELSKQARALQRTVLEGAAYGAVAGAGGAYVFGGGRGGMPGGIFIGVPVGIGSGTYVGYLQQRYATDEARLERLRADVDATNAETAAAVRTMRLVLARQQQQLAAAQPADAASGPALNEAERNLANMLLAIGGADARLSEFGATRALRLVPGQSTGVDAQIADLSARIGEMRAIAATLAEDI